MTEPNSPSTLPIVALIVAAGRGQRARSEAVAGPKQYADLGGVTVLQRAVSVFAEHPNITAVQVVVHPDDLDLYGDAVQPHDLQDPVTGGQTRQESVLRGLEALDGLNPGFVLIHDAARPLVSAGVVDRIVAQLRPDSGVLAALPVADTLKTVSDETVEGTISRDGLWMAQTPQAFDFRAILQAHRKAAQSGYISTDDVGIAEWAGIPVTVVRGSRRNLKITEAADLEFLHSIIAEPTLEYRFGSGFDVHAFEPGNGVTIGGVWIDHDAALKGHSDADVALHALTDAILGAIGDHDIGHHFPPSDGRWKDADSSLFVTFAVERIGELGGSLVNIDLTLICEAPKIGPHREAIRSRVSDLCGLEPARVNIKATTTERLGFAGRREGIAAMAGATVALPKT